MAEECTRNVFVSNGQLRPVADFDACFGNPSRYIYEVFRVQERIPVFIEDHLDRLWKTAELENVALPFSRENLIKQISDLIAANSTAGGDGNIKIFMSFPDKEPETTLVYFTPHQYPTAEQFEKGVAVRLFQAERTNPNAKVMDVLLRSATDEVKSTEAVYEVLLVDRDGFITEGSRSNVFFVKDGLLVTPPVHTVLEGITRKQIMQLCYTNDLAVAEQAVHHSQLPDMDGLFISGTSRRVLPVNRVDHLVFEPGHSVIRNLQKMLAERVQEYLRSKKQ